MVLFAYLAYREQPPLDELRKLNCTVVPWSLGPITNQSTGWPGIWPPCEAGYAFHIVSTISEWLAALCFMMFLLSYTRDFQKITFSEERT